MNSDSDGMIQLQKLVNDLSETRRMTLLPGTDRYESDVEHSMSVAFLSWYIIDTHKLVLDIGKVLQYAMVHDVVEVYAGDVSAFASIKEREAKAVREAAALTRLSSEFGGFPGMIDTINAYETKSDPESLFVWTVDKLQPVVLGFIDQWRAHERLDISYDRFFEKHREQVEKSSPYCRTIYESLLERSGASYYDQPKV